MSLFFKRSQQLPVSQEVDGLDDPRGAIITKTYFINIANTAQSTLQLISRVTGGRARMVNQSENPSYTLNDVSSGSTILPATYSWLDNSAVNQKNGRATYRSDDVDYNVVRKYDLTPILLTNPNVTAATAYGQTVSLPPFQSTQNKNQFIYSRFSDVSNDDTFYSYQQVLSFRDLHLLSLQPCCFELAAPYLIRLQLGQLDLSIRFKAWQNLEH